MLHIQLFRQVKRVVNFYPKLAHGTFQLGVSQEDLYSSQVLHFLVDHRGLAVAHGVRSVRGGMDTAREQIVLLAKSGLLHPGFEAFPGSRRVISN